MIRSASFAACALALVGCGRTGLEAWDSGPSSSTDTPSARDLGAGLGSLLVFQHSIDELAISEDYLFFSSDWQGVYRLPKYGGSLEAVAEDRKAITRGLAANARQVFWGPVTFTSEGIAEYRLLRRAAEGGPVTTMLNGNFGRLLVDDAHVVVASPSDGVPEAISLTDGSIVKIPAEAIFLTQLFFQASSSILDGSSLYVVGCGFTDCGLARGDVTTGAAEMGPLLPGLTVGTPFPTTLAAADDTHLYLYDSHRIWRLRKSDYASADIYNAPANAFVQGPLLVDDSAVYFFTGRSGGLQLVALAKDGGSMRVVSDHPWLVHGTWTMVQDGQFLFLAAAPPNGGDANEIWRLAKAPAVSTD
jgi:hypothetical protein